MAIPNDGAGWGSADERTLSTRDQARVNFLLSYLRSTCRGQDAAKSVAELASAAECSERKVRTLVTYLRQRAHPVLATPDAGYFWPSTRAEAEHTIAFLTARISSTMSVRNGIQRGLDDLFPEVEEGQLELVS